MPSENPKSSVSSAWTSVAVRGSTLDAVEAFQVAYRRKFGRNISQDLVVLTALGKVKVADLPEPDKKPKQGQPALTSKT